MMKKPKELWSWRWNGIVAMMGMIAIILAVATPAIQNAREAAQRTQSKNNLKQIALALHNYADTHRTFPPGGVFNIQDRPFHGWTTLIAPYIEASPFYNGVHCDVPWDHPDQLKHFQRNRTPTYLNPSIAAGCRDDCVMRIHYSGSDLVFYHNSSTSLSDLTNGTSHTLLIGDAKGRFQPFGYPYEWRSVSLGLNSTEEGFGSNVRNVTQMLLADGSVREFSHETDKDVFVALRGVNAKWDQTTSDVSKPAEVYRLSEPLVCLWSNPKGCACIIGVQDESKKIVRAWFHDLRGSWNGFGSPILDRQAAVLKPHKFLRELDVGNSLSLNGIRIVEKFPELEVFKLVGQATTDRGTEILCRCGRLKRLDIGSAEFGDEGWRSLAKLTKLESIEVDAPWGKRFRFSARSVVEFMDQKPDCAVVLSQGRKISNKKIRELAETDGPWPPYDGGN